MPDQNIFFIFESTKDRALRLIHDPASIASSALPRICAYLTRGIGIPAEKDTPGRRAAIGTPSQNTSVAYLKSLLKRSFEWFRVAKSNSGLNAFSRILLFLGIAFDNIFDGLTSGCGGK